MVGRHTEGDAAEASPYLQIILIKSISISLRLFLPSSLLLYIIYIIMVTGKRGTDKRHERMSRHVRIEPFQH